jgi:peptidoglycan/xylan/chitin deacetylase (PgdA/CDA1 family)
MSEVYTPASGLTDRIARRKARLLARRPIPRPVAASIVTFSFDDFPRSAMENALPELTRRGWRGTWYATAGFEAAENHLGALFTRGDLAELARAGQEIGCHTFAHGDASTMAGQAVEADCAKNREALAAMGLKTPLETFAFPYGEASPEAKRALAPRYRALRGVRAGINRKGSDLNLLKAVGLDGGQPGLAAALSHLDALRNRPGWLIFYTHDVRDRPSEWGCTPDFFRTVCEAVEASGAQVLSMAQALDRIEEMAL